MHKNDILFLEFSIPGKIRFDGIQDCNLWTA